MVSMHRGAIIAGNGFVKGSRDVNEPFIFEIPGLGGKILIVFSGHEAGLIENGKKAFANVADELDYAWLNSFAGSWRIMPQFVLFTATSREAWTVKGRGSVPFGQRLANRRIEEIFFPCGRKGEKVATSIRASAAFLVSVRQVSSSS